jgi:hypothetical protein
MTEMVEHVARAMRKRRIELLGNTPADPLDEPNSTELALASAAIKAMDQWRFNRAGIVRKEQPDKFRLDGSASWQS